MRIVIIISMIVLLSACTAMDYGWYMQEYRERLVQIDQDDGQFRLNQIVNLNKSTKDLIESGFSPDFLYETDQQDIWLIDSNKKEFYKLKNDDLFGGVISKQDALPSNISSKIIPKKYYYVIGSANISIHDMDRIYNLNSYSNSSYYEVEIVESEVIRLENSEENKRERYVSGTRREVNPEYYNKLRRYHSAERAYKDTMELNSVYGSSATSAFLSGAVNQLMKDSAQDNYYQRRMELAGESEYIDVPEYSYRENTIEKYNFEKKILLRVSQKQNGIVTDEYFIPYTKVYSYPANTSIERIYRSINNESTTLRLDI